MAVATCSTIAFQEFSSPLLSPPLVTQYGAGMLKRRFASYSTIFRTSSASAAGRSLQSSQPANPA